MEKFNKNSLEPEIDFFLFKFKLFREKKTYDLIIKLDDHTHLNISR